MPSRVDPINQFDLDGRAWRQKDGSVYGRGVLRGKCSSVLPVYALRSGQVRLKAVTKSKWDSLASVMVKVGGYCSWIPGNVGVACGVAQAAGYLMLGDFNAAVEAGFFTAVGHFGGNAAFKAVKTKGGSVLAQKAAEHGSGTIANVVQTMSFQPSTRESSNPGNPYFMPGSEMGYTP